MSVWGGAFGAVDSSLDFIGSLVYSAEEQARDELAGRQIDLGHAELETAEQLSEDALMGRMFSGAQQTGRTRTVALASLVGLVVVVGGAAVVWGDR